MPNKEELANEKKELEQRAFEVKLETREEKRDDKEVGIIEGRPIVFDSTTDLGWFFERIERGALDETDLNDVRLCLNHDTRFVYARSRRNNPNSTMQLTVDPYGMGIRAELDLDSPKARDLYIAVSRGDIDKMSFMFSIEDEEWSDLESDKPTRTIKKIGTVVEVSAVTFPAYQDTSVEIKERSKDALESARRELDSIKQQRAAAMDIAEEQKRALELEKEKLKIRRKNK